MEKLEEILGRKDISGCFMGRSAVPGAERFFTLKDTRGETVATGQGSTCLDAINNAINPRKMPGM